MKTNLLMKRLLLLWVFAFSTTLWGQVTLPHIRTNWDITPSGWTETNKNAYLTSFACSGNNGSKFDASAQIKTVFLNSAPDKLSFVVKSNAANTTSVLLVQESDDNTIFTNVISLTGTSLPTTCTTKGDYQLLPSTRYVKWTFTKGSQNLTMDDVVITKKTITTPIINTTGTFSNFTYIVGNGPSTEQPFTVSGSNLTDNITVTAPANFEVSTNSGSGFASSVNLAQTGGAVAETTLYARMVANLGVDDTYSGNIVLSSTDADDVTIALSGEVKPVPTVVTYNLVQFPNTTQNIAEGTILDVYIRAYAAGVTDVSGESTRLKGWVGYSSTNDDPANAGWNWIPAIFNTEDGNNDEYKGTIPNNLTPGTYYYAARFELDNSGAYTYGGSAGNWSNDNVKLNVVADVVNFANIQSPASTTIIAGNTVTVYAQVYEPGVTEAAGQGAGITAEIGYSKTDPTPDGTWTWLPATFNVQSGNNDEYQANLGTGLTSGVYYYASRFIKTGSSTYVYGGTDGNWTTGKSGVLTVNNLDTPIAITADPIGATSFAANWEAVTGATDYELDVYNQIIGASPNLVVNPGFENPNLDNWTFESSMNQVISSSQVKTGTSSLYSTVTATKNFNQPISVENGKEYKLKFSYYIDPTSTGNGFRVWTTTGATVQLPSTSTYFNTKGTWVNVENTFTSSDSNLILNLRLYNGVKIYFDDFEIIKTESSSTTNYVLNASHVGNVTSYEVAGLTPETEYFYVIRAKSGVTTSPNSNEIAVMTAGTPTTWEGSVSGWSDGTPNTNKNAIIAADYTGESFTSKSLIVNAGFTLTVPSNGFVKTGNVTNSGNILVANNGNFVQTGTFTAEAGSTFKVNRTTKPVVRLDYNSWSSPLAVSNQKLTDFSTGTLPARFLTYSNSAFVPVSDIANAKFRPGAGYLIRTPNNYTANPTPFEGQFEGTVPNSGDVTYDPTEEEVGGPYVFLGNPYPSAISMEDFAIENNAKMQTGTFYIWNSQSKMNSNNEYENAYISHTAAGSNPYGSEFYVPVGQGFIIDRGAKRGAFNFKNSMRRTAETGSFAKTSVTDRFWLQMTSPSGLKPQLLVAFTPNSTSGYDAGFDGKLLESNGDFIYSTVEDKSLIINALGIFSSDDEIKVSSNFKIAGNYTMSIAQKEGLFESGQKIYLKDNVTGTETELTAGDYTFAASAGLNVDRFSLLFTKPVLVTSDAAKNQITIYIADQMIHIKSTKKLSSFEVYEMSGKLIKTARNVNSHNVSIPVTNKGVAIVKMVTENGEVVTKKVILK